MKTLPSTLLLTAVGALLAGCTPDLTSVQLTQITTPPLEVTVSPAGISLPDGIAVAVDVMGINDEGDEEDNLSVSAASGSVGSVETETTDRFVLYGISPGTDTLTFTATSVDGSVDVPVTVTAQP